MPVPNTGPAKFLWAAGGLAAGTSAAYGINSAFVSPARDKELELEKGTTRSNSSETRYKAMAGAFGVSAGLAMGLGKRAGTTGLTTATHLAVGALLSSVASGMMNHDKADTYMQGLSFMIAGVGAGALLSVRDEASRLPLRGASLASAGVALGLMVPSVINGTRTGFGDLSRGISEK